MKNDKVFLTFETDRKTSWLLKSIAHSFNMTQPELINDICKDFIDNILKEIEKMQNNKEENIE